MAAPGGCVNPGYRTECDFASVEKYQLRWIDLHRGSHPADMQSGCAGFDRELTLSRSMATDQKS
jgi:hypothetical protein